MIPWPAMASYPQVMIYTHSPGSAATTHYSTRECRIQSSPKFTFDCCSQDSSGIITCWQCSSQSKTQDKFCEFLQKLGQVLSHHNLARLTPDMHDVFLNSSWGRTDRNICYTELRLSQQDGLARSLNSKSGSRRPILSDIGASRVNHFPRPSCFLEPIQFET